MQKINSYKFKQFYNKQKTNKNNWTEAERSSCSLDHMLKCTGESYRRFIKCRD